MSYHPSTNEEPTMKTLLIALLGVFAISLSACNTIEGAGKDVKATGQAVENVANDAKPK
jgi:entericidin B